MPTGTAAAQVIDLGGRPPAQPVEPSDITEITIVSWESKRYFNPLDRAQVR